MNFISLQENKADLARFLSEELLANEPSNMEIVVAGGFGNENEVKSSLGLTNLIPLRATREVADTWLVLHAITMDFDTIVVCARDINVLVVLVAHLSRMNCNDIWLMAGTAKKRRYTPIGLVYDSWPTNSDKALLAFHALT